ncbi:MAG: toll/interleukin-1 receptor domain-containing protein [Candidatus Thiodiazotropha sp.]
MSQAATRPLRVFLAHSSGDKSYVRSLNELLKLAGFEPWLDEDQLVAGQDWELEIEKAVERSDVVAIFLSERAVNTTGYLHKEIALALEAAQSRPEGALYRVPLLLDYTEPPRQLRHLHWIDVQGIDRIEIHTKEGWEIKQAFEEREGFFIGESYLRLQRALIERVKQLGPSVATSAAFGTGRYLVHGRRPDGGEYFGTADLNILDDLVFQENISLIAKIAGQKYEYSGKASGYGFFQLSGPQNVSYHQTGRNGILAGTWGKGGLEELIPYTDHPESISNLY